MGYLSEFQKEIANRNFPKFMFLWEEYCTSDSAPVQELRDLLSELNASEFKGKMGGMVETILPLIHTLQNPDEVHSVLIPLFDIQTTHSQELYDLALSHAERLYKAHPHYNDMLRLVGLRPKGNFQGALSALELLAHLGKGKFVFHHGGWDTGEVMDISFLKETGVFEFEKAGGQKNITLSNAMRSMKPLPNTHFLARRFGDPDKLEKEAKNDPVAVVKLLLKDLGPKTASEIKDELEELVIPEKEWVKWWQSARAKLKKDLSIETPVSLKDPFHIRDETLSHEEEFVKQMASKKKATEILAVCHAFSKEHTAELKEEGVKKLFLETLAKLENQEGISLSRRFEIALMKRALFNSVSKEEMMKLFAESKNLVFDLEGIEILQFKKSALGLIRDENKEWQPLFVELLSVAQEALIRDYIVKELHSQGDLLDSFIQNLVTHPGENPDLFFWFFNRAVIQKKKDEGTEETPEMWWEALLVLLNKIENMTGYADLIKKIGLVITANRYMEVRELFKSVSYEFMKEFLLLASKCHTITPHDLKSLKSLAAVRFPALASSSADGNKEEIIWASKEAYLNLQERIRHIATVETVDNAKEIEAARALGDLRENSEYKYAKERRSRLQGEMRHLSQMLSQVRILNEEDVSLDEAGPGSVVVAMNEKGESFTYILMGPLDADPDKGILSLQSKLAEAMLGKKVGESFQFKDETFTIQTLKSVFE